MWVACARGEVRFVVVWLYHPLTHSLIGCTWKKRYGGWSKWLSWDVQLNKLCALVKCMTKVNPLTTFPMVKPIRKSSRLVLHRNKEYVCYFSSNGEVRNVLHLRKEVCCRLKTGWLRLSLHYLCTAKQSFLNINAVEEATFDIWSGNSWLSIGDTNRFLQILTKKASIMKQLELCRGGSKKQTLCCSRVTTKYEYHSGSCLEDLCRIIYPANNWIPIWEWSWDST